MVSAYSIGSAVIFYNLSLILVFLLRRKALFLARYSTSLLLFLTVLGIVRLFTPVDLSPAFIITSETVLPAVQHVLKGEIPGLGIEAGQFLLLLWGAGTAGVTGWNLIETWKKNIDMRSCTYIADPQVQMVAAELGVQCPVMVVTEIQSPFSSGIFRPKIYLPCLPYTDEQLFYILKHESQHIASHDMLVKLLFLVIQALFWWNPIVYIFRKEIDVMLELQCDAKVTADFDGDSVDRYMRTMTEVARYVTPGCKKAGVSAVSFAGDPSVMVQRFDLLFRRKQRLEKRYRILMASLFFVCFLLSYFVILQPFYEFPSSDISGYIDITPDNSYILYEDGEYYFCLYGEKIEVLTKDDLSREPYNHLELKGD